MFLKQIVSTNVTCFSIRLFLQTLHVSRSDCFYKRCMFLNQIISTNVTCFSIKLFLQTLHVSQSNCFFKLYIFLNQIVSTNVKFFSIKLFLQKLHVSQSHTAINFKAAFNDTEALLRLTLGRHISTSKTWYFCC